MLTTTARRAAAGADPPSIRAKRGLIFRPWRPVPAALGLALVFLFVPSVQAEQLMVSRINTDDIVVPRFDTGLGTLTSVNLEVTLLGGLTSNSGNHSHGPVTLSSTNVFSSAPSNFSPAFTPTTTGGGHSHSMITPAYSGSGLNIGSFSLPPVTGSSHTHTLSITPTTPQLLGLSGNWVARVIVSLNPAGNSAHSYPSETKNLLLSGSELAPFTTGTGDITIPAGTSSLGSSGSHQHGLSFFGNVQLSAGGFASASFSNNSPFAGSHSHSYDPQFNVVATFEYTPIPEPATATLAATAACALVFYGSRTRRKKRAAM